MSTTPPLPISDVNHVLAGDLETMLPRDATLLQGVITSDATLGGLAPSAVLLPNEIAVAGALHNLVLMIGSDYDPAGSAAAITPTTLGLGNVNNTSDVNKPISTATQAALNAKADLVQGLVPSTQLPSYVDDVQEYSTLSAFPASGAGNIIYIAIDSNQQYRWSGSQYIELSQSIALGTTSSSAYPGNLGATAYTNAAQALAEINEMDTSEISDDTAINGAGRTLKVLLQWMANTMTLAANRITGLSTSVTSGSTNAQIPSAAAVWTALTNAISSAIAGISLAVTVATPTNLNGILKANGANVTTAVAGTDYLASQANADWNASSGVAQILNKPIIPANSADGTIYSEPVATARTSSSISDTVGETILINGVGSGSFTGYNNNIATGVSTQSPIFFTNFEGSVPSNFSLNGNTLTTAKAHSGTESLLCTNQSWITFNSGLTAGEVLTIGFWYWGSPNIVTSLPYNNNWNPTPSSAWTYATYQLTIQSGATTDVIITWQPDASPLYIDDITVTPAGLAYTFSAPKTGQIVAAQDTGIEWHYNGTAWVNLLDQNATIAAAQLPTMLQRMLAAENALGSVGGTVTIDCSISCLVSMTLTSSITTLNITNMLAGQKMLLRIVQGGVGSYTIAWPAAIVDWSGQNKTLQTAVGKRDIVTFSIQSNGTQIDAFMGNMG